MDNDFISMSDNAEKPERKFPKPGPVAAIVVMIIELFIFMFVMAPAQYYWGMWGLVVTELSLVVMSLVAAWVVGLDIKEMLRIKKIKVNEFFGTIVIWTASLLFLMIANLTFFYFFPDGLTVNESINEFTSQWPIVPTLFVVGIMPAICEEMLHRGFIQRCMMRKFKSRMLISILMGIFFGIFHMDFYRFLGTAILGGVLSYILVVTDNFFYNMLFHFVNNFSVQLLAYFTSKMPDSDMGAAAEMMTGEVIAVGLASYLIIGCLAPMIMFGGILLLKGKKKIADEGKTKFFIELAISIGLSIAMAGAGFILMIVFAMNGYLDAAATMGALFG